MAGNDRPGRDVAYDHRARANQGALSDLDSAHHNRAASDRSAPAHHGVLHLPVALGLRRAVGGGRARISVVDEDDAVTNEDFVLDGDARTYERMAGDLASPADLRVTLDFDERSNPRVVTNLAAVEIDV